MTTPLASLEDFLVLGLPATALVPPPRPVEAVDPTLDRLLLKGHGLLTGDIVRWEVTGTNPAPLSTTELYEAVPIDLDLFQLRYVSGPNAGQIVDITTAGTKPIEFRVDPRPMFEAALLAASATVQDHATAHSEITTGTPQTKKITCVLAAEIVMSTNRLRLPLNEKQLENLQLRIADAWITLRTWQKGKPIAGVVDATPTTPEVGARGSLVSGAPAPSSSGGWGWGCEL